MDEQKQTSLQIRDKQNLSQSKRDFVFFLAFKKKSKIYVK